tara:strand:- start:818 stop:961 length:144 start_codon:yes stop_codon:yes gene_type:complete
MANVWKQLKEKPFGKLLRDMESLFHIFVGKMLLGIEQMEIAEHVWLK